MSTACAEATQCRRYPALVVAGALCKEGKVLIQRRSEGMPGGGLWEFPGGKIEPGETPEEALRRELGEETCVAIHHAEILQPMHPSIWCSSFSPARIGRAPPKGKRGKL